MIKAISKILDTVLIAIAAVVLGADVLIAFSSVFLGAFGISYATLHELPRLSMSCVAFLGLGAALKSGQHVSVDLVLVFVKGRIRTTLEALIYMIICAAVVFLFLASMDTMLWLKTTGQTLQAEWEFPLWYLYIFQLIGFAVLFLYSLAFAADRVTHLINPRFGKEIAPLTGATTE